MAGFWQWQGDPTTGSGYVSTNARKPFASASILIGTGAVHTAGDIVSTDAGAILQFETGLPAGNGGVILSSYVTSDNDAVFSGGAGYTLYLFTASPTPQADNAVYNLAVADLSKAIGKITISTLSDKGDSCSMSDFGHNVDFALAAADTKLYGKLVCNGGETTISGKTITINLGIAAL
jgi:hypothetical protein